MFLNNGLISPPFFFFCKFNLILAVCVCVCADCREGEEKHES